jgi:hypothetical protein
MYQQKCPIYRNSKAVRDMVLLLMMGFAGPLKRLRYGDGICRPTEKMVARRWNSPARGKECGAAMGFASPLK